MFTVLSSSKQIGSRLLRVARVLLAAAVLLAVLSTAVPFTIFASGPMCALACCAGRAPHAAGSCMNGSCHASLSGHTKKPLIHFEARIEQGEELCGLPRIKLYSARLPAIETVTIYASSDISQRASKTAPDQASISTTALTKPCQADCGSCGSGFTNSNRQRNAAALAYADRPRPPSGLVLGKVDYRPTRKLSALCRRGTPRGPPSFS